MLKKIRRQLTQSSFAQYISAWLAYLYMELVYHTSSWQYHNAELPASFWDQGKPIIVCFWHGRLLCMARAWRKGVKGAMISSHHRDGKFTAAIIRHYGVGTVFGSTSRGGAAALRQTIDKIADGYSIGLTPDGPRGPRFRAATGAVYLAKTTGLPIVPVSVATTRRKMLYSWDRFLVCWPFSRGVYVWGDPIYVPKDCDDTELESYRQKLEWNLIDVSNRSDLLCGHMPIPLDDAAVDDMMDQRKAS
jgi:lysophospholipid acyltransferase (LPLAT)-like uncharacterized protein